MWFNITSILGLLLSIFMITRLLKSKQGDNLLTILAIILLAIKTLEYMYMNITTGFTYPIEISQITYFLFCIVVLFRIKKLYHVAAFFGIISGIGFFLYYSTLGYISAFYHENMRHYIAVIAHGILLIGGVYLLVKNDFRKTNKLDLLLAMVAILAHASIFYTDAIKGTTFVYFLIKPEFLKVSSSDALNHLLMIAYYFTAFSIYSACINKFYKLNEKYISNKHNLAIT